MPHTFSRQDLFDLVWSEPTRTLAKRLGISDVGLAKACRRADLLLPPRGYWAKLAAGKRVGKPELPPRSPGMSDRIVLGQDRWSWGPDPVDLSTPDPPVLEFAETLEELADRVRKQIGAVRRTRDLNTAHPRILKLLGADEQRRARQAASPFPLAEPPLFETPLAKRRLRVLNSLMRALDRVNVSVSIEDPSAGALITHVGDHCVSFSIVAGPSKSHAKPAKRAAPLCVQLMALCGGGEVVESWLDAEGQPLESRLADIAVAIVVHGERLCRTSAHHHRERVIRRKAELAEEERRKFEERRRLERERRERVEQARVARMLAQARAMKEAREIRDYVAAVREAQTRIDQPLSEPELRQWVEWALNQADRIDPVLNGSFRTVEHDE